MAVKIIKGNAEDGGWITNQQIHITMRELQVLKMMADGFENEEAAEKLKINVNTLRNHQYNIMRKLGTKTRTHAVTVAIQMGMLATDREQAYGTRPRGKNKYMWCLHCERTYDYGEFRVERIKPFTVDHVKYTPEFEMCPYEDCDGDAVLDSWTWKSVREDHPEYPELPERGKVYPLYP